MYLVVPPFYRHCAPLERKAIPFPHLLTFASLSPLSHFPTFPLSPLPASPFPAQGYGTRRVPTTLLKNLKPPHHPQRSISSIIAGDLPGNPFFRPEPKNPAIPVNFFTKKLLTDDCIRCIIGCLKLYRGEIMSTFRGSRIPANPRKPTQFPRLHTSHERIPNFYDTRERRLDTV